MLVALLSVVVFLPNAVGTAAVHVDELVTTAPGVRLRVLTRGRDAALPVLVYTPFAWTFPAITSGDRLFLRLEESFLLASYDPRGVGGSSNSTPPLTTDDFARDIIDVAEYACRRFEKEKVYVLGISTGATFAAIAAHAAPHLFHHVVANGPTISMSEQYENCLRGVEDVWRVPTFVSRHLLPLAVFGVLVMLRLPFHRCRSEWWCDSEFFTPLTYMFSDHYKHGASTFFQAAIAFDAVQQLGDVRTHGLGDRGLYAYNVPMTFIGGEFDVYMANVDTLRAYVHRASTVSRSPVSLEVMPNASHALHIEQMDAFLDIVRGVRRSEDVLQACGA
jgi:pimeloyl-ACP methyl ester carboxylesterase